MSTEVLTLVAPAKINLFLHITGKQASGYHSLQSLIFFADIGDVLRVQVAQKNQLISGGEFAHQLPPPHENLVLHALGLLQQQIPLVPSLQIELQKNLPVASGMGGGSADAAAVLRAAVALTSQEITAEMLHPLLCKLGAEMPVCYNAKAAWVEGIGERIISVPAIPEWGILLVNPLIGLPTAEAFSAMYSQEFVAERSMIAPKNEAEWRNLAQQTCNNMTMAAIRKVPQIEQVLKALGALPECFLARMSGSGATCFALFPSRRQAEMAEATIQQQYSEWWIKAGGIDQHRMK